MTVLASGAAMLERAIGYTLGTIQAVSPEQYSNPTPCTAWNLRMLLEHLNDSLDVLQQISDTQHIESSAIPAPDHNRPMTDPMMHFRRRATQLLGSWSASAYHDRMTDIACLPLPNEIAAYTGALEIAVHGWDISQACGHHQPIPTALATDMLQIAPILVTEATRQPLFAAPARVSQQANPSDRLIAFLGRRPDA
ncbi:TIGR03086 family metal-binding protein [Actinoallomurus acanthiterrae]